MGYVAWIGKKDTIDSVLTTMLLQAGAVFYVKTSVPQTLMVCEAINNVFGRTTNPRNKTWSCGGSSGGEGAIIGLRGGVLGVGTDIGEYIRSIELPDKSAMLTNHQVVQSGSQQPSTSSTASGLVTVVFPMLRWPTVWKDKRPCTAWSGPLPIPWPICDSLSHRFSPKSLGPMIRRSSQCHGEAAKRRSSRRSSPPAD